MKSKIPFKILNQLAESLYEARDEINITGIGLGKISRMERERLRAKIVIEKYLEIKK